LPVCHPQTAEGRFHSLELPQAGRGTRRQQACRPSRLEGSRAEAASAERYLVSDDPDFETKAADIIGLYLNPPQHAAVFCVDEKTAIQALDRLDPVLPLSPGRIERHEFEY
jgi:hypothetical protein